ncbi:MAG: class I SAM-dependent methyltransferase [Spirochaetales bacterium]|nr:class I SAM-dependent methyltransferase [Spirochaetales bacterium]
MNYKKENKEAWNEAFFAHKKGWEKSPVETSLLRGEWLINNPLIAELENIGIKGKCLGQLCCNNGRELLSVLKMGAAKGYGFDIADNFITEAKRLACLLNLPAEFITSDIPEIPEDYNKKCDILIITIGALCWFQDLFPFFSKAADLLKTGGWIIINEQHPFTDMIAAPGEAEFDESSPNTPKHSYFRKEPWIESQGMDYIGGTLYNSKTFYSFSHSMSEIINNLSLNNFHIKKLQEYDYDISSRFSHLSQKGWPLSYLLSAQKV